MERRQNTSSENVDYELALAHGCEIVLVSSLNDTGVPQSLVYSLMGKCVYKMTAGACIYNFAAVISLFGITTSRTSTAYMIAATIPYGDPYDWMQVSLVTSLVGGLCWAPYAKPAIDHVHMCIYLVITASLTIGLGVFLLQGFHTSPECSQKLADCSF